MPPTVYFAVRIISNDGRACSKSAGIPIGSTIKEAKQIIGALYEGPCDQDKLAFWSGAKNLLEGKSDEDVLDAQTLMEFGRNTFLVVTLLE